MNSGYITYYENYTPVGDILAVTMCIVFLTLIRRAYINRTKSFEYLKSTIIVLIVASLSDVVYHVMMNNIGKVPNVLIYLPRAVYHIGLFIILWLFVFYMKEPLHLDGRWDKKYEIIATTGLVVIILYEIAESVTHIGFYITESGEVHRGFLIFPIAEIFFVGIVGYAMIKNRNRIYKQIILCVADTIGISIFILIIQGLHNQTSYTAATFLFPIFALLYLMHSNPYDLDIGAVSAGAFEDLIENTPKRDTSLYLMSLYMHDFDGKGRNYPPEIRDTVRRFTEMFFREAMLFQISGGHMILVADIKKDPDYETSSMNMLEAFYEIYPQYRLDYKVVYTPTFDKLTRENEYVGFITYLHGQMTENEFKIAKEEDVEKYLRHKYILSEMTDINDKQNMDDERVEVYCQPVYNINTGTYDTAEALMRLRLPDTGMVFPDEFIPIAEQIRVIHTLTKIILSKTCRQIRTFLDEGYALKRISVNFSVYDIEEDDFCASVEEIIKSSGISFDKIAIEITESQNERDYELVKERLGMLKDSGIKFYLDDFGTGYSNFERISEMPFDIIKFDRSLVAASRSDEKYGAMVSHLAGMFTEAEYAVLYEGVEDEGDESRCIQMSAKYLQGYKYSKPIPIENLNKYLLQVV